MAKEYLDKSGLSYFWGKLKAYFQEKLVSGTNIKTINNQSVLGSGNLSIAGSSEVTDVQINSTSIVNNGVASIPSASSSSYGIIKAELTSLDPPNPIVRFTIGFDPGSTAFAVPRLNSNNKVPTYLLPIADASNVDVGLMDDTLFELNCDNNGELSLFYNSEELSAVSITPSKIGAVPTTRKVNSKALSSNITLTASDVGALATSGGNITGNLSYRSSTINASLANNGVSSTQYPTTFNILDKSGRILTRKEAAIESNGNISAYWYVRNYNTSGTQVGQKGIKITMNKSGAVTYAVDEPDKFLSAISAVPTSRTVNSKALSGNITLSAGDVGAVAKSVCCYANSRVDTFSNGRVSIPLANFGITNGAKPVGVLMTYQDGGATPTILQYDYDASNSTNVIIKAYNSSGGAVNGAVRYFAMVFQGSWTKP